MTRNVIIANGKSPPRLPPVMRGITAEIRGVREELNAARDEQVARVVALVDAMPERGAADALVAPLRARLAVLRPGRPFRFTRLLFTPINPVIVAPIAWRRGDGTVPRHTLEALAAIVRTAIGPLAGEIDQALAQRTGPSFGDGSGAVEEVGRLVWSRASQILATASAPESWQHQTSLTNADFLLLAATVSALLGTALDRQILAGQMQERGAADPRRLSRVITASLAAPPDTACMAVGLLLVDTPRPDLMLQAVDAHSAVVGTPAAVVTERGIGFALDHVQHLVTTPSELAHTMQSLRDGMMLIQALEFRTWLGGDRRSQIHQLRRSASESCRATFVRTMATQFMAPMTAQPGCPSDTQMLRLERTARDLRGLAAIGRSLGHEPLYGIELRDAAACVRGRTAWSVADRVRLVELLDGPDPATMLLLESLDPPAGTSASDAGPRPC